MVNSFIKTNYKQAIVVFVIAIFAFWLSKLTLENDSIQSIVSAYGYAGIFLISAISGFNLIIPIPVATFLPVFLNAGLDFWYVILAISFGMTMGDTLGFLVGKAGKVVLTVHMRRMMKKLEGWQKKNPKSPLIFLSIYSAIAPLPNELVVVPLAFMGYRLKHVFPIIFIGNFIFNILLAKGIITIFNAF